MRDDGRQLALALFVPTVIEAKGGGEYLVKPGKPIARLTVAEAARALRTSTDSIYRLINSGQLRCDRPTPHGIRVHADSVHALITETGADPEFWANAERVAAYSATLRSGSPAVA